MVSRFALPLAAFLICVPACSAPKGAEGGPCKCDGCEILGGGRFYCDDGLLCNRGSGPYTCQRAGSVGTGGACNAFEQVDPSAPVLCAAGLTCTYSQNVDASVSKDVVACTPPAAWCCEPLPPPCGQPPWPSCAGMDSGAPDAGCWLYDLNNDPAHCGTCTHACASGEACSKGQCTAPDSGVADADAPDGDH